MGLIGKEIPHFFEHFLASGFGSAIADFTRLRVWFVFFDRVGRPSLVWLYLPTERLDVGIYVGRKDFRR